jgi:WS/DGAT/MGAT family acyltransferase
MIPLSVQDSTFLALEKPNMPWNGGVIFVYDRTNDSGKMTFQDVFEHFQARLHLVDALRLKVVRVPGNLSRPYWVEDPDLDLEYHMRNIALPPPGDWRQFCLQISRLIARPLDLTRPPWELYMIEGLDAIERFSRGSFALVLKVHHAALDGRAFLAIMNILHSLDPDAPPPSPDKDREVELEPSTLDLLLRAGIDATQSQMAAARTLGRALPGLARTMLSSKGRDTGSEAELREKPPQTPAPRTRFNGPVGPHRSWGACFFDLADTRTIRNAVEGATVHDIAISVIGGALRSYLGELGELPSDPLKTAIMIDVRTEEDRQGLGNQISGMFSTMATDIEEPLERLAAVRASTRRGKKTSYKSGARDMAGLLELVPEVALSPAMEILLAVGNQGGSGLFSKFNTAVTGMAGPPKPLYLGGARMTHLIGFGPVMDGMAIMNVQHSYDGEFVLTFTADREAMPDPQRYEECIYRAFAELLEASRGPREKARAKAVKKIKASRGTRAKASPSKTPRKTPKVGTGKRAAAGAGKKSASGRGRKS